MCLLPLLSEVHNIQIRPIVLVGMKVKVKFKFKGRRAPKATNVRYLDRGEIAAAAAGPLDRRAPLPAAAGKYTKVDLAKVGSYALCSFRLVFGEIPSLYTPQFASRLVFSGKKRRHTV